MSDRCVFAKFGVDTAENGHPKAEIAPFQRTLLVIRVDGIGGDRQKFGLWVFICIHVSSDLTSFPPSGSSASSFTGSRYLIDEPSSYLDVAQRLRAARAIRGVRSPTLCYSNSKLERIFLTLTKKKQLEKKLE